MFCVAGDFPGFCFYTQSVLSCVKNILFSTNVMLLLKSQGINVSSETQIFILSEDNRLTVIPELQGP